LIRGQWIRFYDFRATPLDACVGRGMNRTTFRILIASPLDAISTLDRTRQEPTLSAHFNAKRHTLTPLTTASSHHSVLTPKRCITASFSSSLPVSSGMRARSKSNNRNEPERVLPMWRRSRSQCWTPA